MVKIKNTDELITLFYDKAHDKIKQKVRNAAVKNVDQKLEDLKRSSEEYSLEEYRELLREEEIRIIKKYVKEGAKGAVVLSLFPWVWF